MLNAFGIRFRSFFGHANLAQEGDNRDVAVTCELCQFLTLFGEQDAPAWRKCDPAFTSESLQDFGSRGMAYMHVDSDVCDARNTIFAAEFVYKFDVVFGEFGVVVIASALIPIFAHDTSIA